MAKRLKVVVLMGGPSAEREISVATGKNVLEHLDKKKYNAVPLMIERAARFAVELAAAKGDLVFNALHGTFGEDGAVQGLLESLGIPYTGSGVLASALGMNKRLSRQLFAANGIPVPRSLFFTRAELGAQLPDCALRTGRAFGYPCIVKPNAAGSSAGVSIVEHPNQFERAVETALQFDGAILVEEYLGKQEITVPVVGGENPRVLPAVEIIPSDEFFTYRAKYSGTSQEICPARFDEVVIREASNSSLRAHRLLGARGVTRVDMILKNRKPYVLEINTLPGLTTESLVPKSAWVAGTSFEKLLDLLIEDAVRAMPPQREKAPHTGRITRRPARAA